MSGILWNDGWRFYLEQVEEAPFLTQSRKNQESGGYAARNFNDTCWQKVTLPHDWAMEFDYCERASRSHGHFPTTTQEMDGEVPGKGAFTRVPTKGWYRKRFDAPAQWSDKRVILRFEGAFRDAHVWINGQYFDRYLSGYMGFACDITDNLYFGGENVIAVCCDTREIEGWWYEGAGIYRNVFLDVKPELYLDEENIAVSADMNGGFTLKGEAVYKGFAEAAAELSWKLERKGKTVLGGGKLITSADLSFEFSEKAENPDLWSPDEPNLYTLTLSLGEDAITLNTGFRTFRFDADKGLFVNEKPIKIKGCCIHQDFAGVGVALPDGLQEYKIRRLKDMGANAYRSSHNAPAPEIVDACDRLGMLLMDETRMFGSSPAALRDTLGLVRRDRNHPCVLMWSIGNEEHSVQNTVVGERLAKSVMKSIRELDDTRVITYGGNNGGVYEGVNGAVDVRGVNYVHIHQWEGSFVDEYHAKHPEQPMYGSEEVSALASRGEYRGSLEHVSEYGENMMPWSSSAEGWWKYYCERDFLAGGFIWTGFDYFGEPTPYVRNVSTSFGAIDLCGFPKEMYHYYRTWWRDEPNLRVFPHWNWNDGETVRVVAYSNQDEVELFVNGRSLGRKPVEVNGHIEWQVPFEKGELSAVAYRGGKAVLTQKRVTAGEAKHIVLSAEAAAPGSDIRLIRAEIVDENGDTVPDADNLITFKADGGEIIGVGNGDPACREKNRFPEEKQSLEVTEWYEVTGDELVPYDAFVLTRGEYWHLHSVADRRVREENVEPFRDSVRIVQRQVVKKAEASYVGYFDAKEGFDTLEFTRINGSYTVKLNGEEIGRGNNEGYPCAFEIKPVPGRNRIEVTCAGTWGPGSITDGVQLTRRVSPVWTRSAYHALALAIVKAGSGARVTASADGLESAEVTV